MNKIKRLIHKPLEISNVCGRPHTTFSDTAILSFSCKLKVTAKCVQNTRIFSIIRYFLPNPGRILPALTEKSKIKNCLQWGLNPGPFDPHSNNLLTELSHYLVVCVNH